MTEPDQPLDLAPIQARHPDGDLYLSTSVPSVIQDHHDIRDLIAEVLRLRELLDVAEHARARADEAAQQSQATLDAMPRCDVPHPVAEGARCELTVQHPGWHAAQVGAWPGASFPRGGIDSWPTAPA